MRRGLLSVQSIGNVLEWLVCRIIHQRTSQSVKWTSGARVWINAFSSLNRCHVRSLVGSIGPSIPRSITPTLDRSIAWLLDRSLACSLDCSIARSLDRSLDRSIAWSHDRSIAWSLARSLKNSPWDQNSSHSVIKDSSMTSLCCVGEGYAFCRGSKSGGSYFHPLGADTIVICNALTFYCQLIPSNSRTTDLCIIRSIYSVSKEKLR